MTIKQVTLEDIQPGAEFYTVMGGKTGQNAYVCKNTVVLNSFPTYWSLHADGDYEDDGDHSWVNYSSLSNGKIVNNCVSLRDKHVIRTEKSEKMSYNFNRWFHTAEDADMFLQQIQSGKFDHPADQALYDSFH